MRRTIALLALSASMAVLAPLGARADGVQTVNGSILLPTRYPDSTAVNADGSWPGAGRKLYLASMSNDAATGQVMALVKIDPATQNGEFSVGNIVDATNQADLDVTFYIDLGDDVYGTTPADSPDDPAYQVARHVAGGESGPIPEEAVYALVTMATGLNATFTWTGTPAGDGR
jgi:hypothetical protein